MKRLSPPAIARDTAARTVPTRHEPAPEYWDIRDIQFQLRIGRTFAWQLVKAEDFPPPVVLGSRRMCWLAADVRDYMATRRDVARYRPVARRNEIRGLSYVVRPPRRRR